MQGVRGGEGGGGGGGGDRPLLTDSLILGKSKREKTAMQPREIDI